MDIGIDISPLQNGHRFRGIGSYARGLLHGLSRLDPGDRFVLYYWKRLPLDTDGIALPRNTRLVGVPFPPAGRLSALAGQQLLMLPLLFAYRPDVYHQLGVVADPASGGVPWALADRCVVTMHDLTPLVYRERFFNGKRARELVYRFMLTLVRRCRHVLADSYTTQRDLQRFLGLKGDQISVVPLAVGPELMELLQRSEPPDLPAGFPDSYILAVAGDYPNKNLRTLLAAFSQVHRRRDTTDLVVVGPPGPSLTWFKAQDSTASAHVHLFPFLNTAQLANAYRGATVVVVPSEYEGFGLPVLEAMAAGTPVIAANAASLSEVAGDAAVLVAAHDSDALAETIMCVCADTAARARLEAKGRERAREFSWERTAELTLQAYYKAAR